MQANNAEGRKNDWLKKEEERNLTNSVVTVIYIKKGGVSCLTRAVNRLNSGHGVTGLGPDYIITGPWPELAVLTLRFRQELLSL